MSTNDLDFPVCSWCLFCAVVTVLLYFNCFAMSKWINIISYIVSGGALNSTHSLTTALLLLNSCWSLERMKTAVPLLKCLRTPLHFLFWCHTRFIIKLYCIMDGIANHFQYCKILHIQFKIFSVVILSDPTHRRPMQVLGPRHQYPLGSPAFPLFLFYETTTARSKRRTPVTLPQPNPNEWLAYPHHHHHHVDHLLSASVTGVT